MKLQIAATNMDYPYQVPSPKNNSLCASYSSIKERRSGQYLSPFKSRKLFKSLVFLDKCDSRVHKIGTACWGSLDEGFAQNHVEGGLAQSWGLSDDEDSRSDLINSGCCATSETKPSPSKDRGPTLSKNSFWQSQVDLLEPKMLGIMPEPPDWPERESVMWADVEQKAKSFGLPFSLKMIQKKQQREGGLKGMEELTYSSLANAFSSMVSIIVELQSCALQMREVLCDEDLGLIIFRVQKDMHSSFFWLFHRVFSRTPALMVHVMILLANFSVYSTSHNYAAAEASLIDSLYETAEEMESLQHSQPDDLLMTPLASADSHRNVTGVESEASEAMSLKYPEELLPVGYQILRNAAEVSLWNSFLDEARKMQAGPNELVLDHDVLQKLVSPISVELEPDNYIEFLRTDLMYQMGLSQEPDNPLLLSNYAQFLQVIAHDYDRAEECFKRAVQVEPPDAESVSRYAEFLWIVRKDLWRAEDTYLQALSIEPENSYYASKYANFLWNTGGEDTCFPLDAPNTNDRDPNV